MKTFASVQEASRYLNAAFDCRFWLARVREDRYHADGRTEYLETFYVHDSFGNDATSGATIGEAVAKAEDRLRAMVAHG